MTNLLRGERKKSLLRKLEQATKGFQADQIINFLRNKVAISRVCAGFSDELAMEVIEEKFKYLSTYSSLFN